MTERSITLTELLQSRDERQALQRHMLACNRGLTLMVTTIIMPGPVKRNRCTRIAAQAAEQAISQAFGTSLVSHFSRDLATGYEGWYLFKLPAREVKSRTCHIEETHPLGRLFDFDVLRPDGKPLSRVAIGLPERRCMLCDNEARLCMRSRTHSQADLLAHIQSLIDNYVRRH